MPECFTHAIRALATHVVNEAPFEQRSEYTEILGQVDIVVSTSNHEFFGISMLEATLSGAYPLVPNRLVYPEIYPAEFRFDADEDLARRLTVLIGDYMEGRSLRADRRHLFEQLVTGVDEQFRRLFMECS